MTFWFFSNPADSAARFQNVHVDVLFDVSPWQPGPATVPEAVLWLRP